MTGVNDSVRLAEMMERAMNQSTDELSTSTCCVYALRDPDTKEIRNPLLIEFQKRVKGGSKGKRRQSAGKR